MPGFVKRLAVVALGALALSACNKPVEDFKEEGQVDILELLNKEDQLYQDMTIQSTYKKRVMTYSVWLPNGYDKRKEYPFLYLLHGYEQGDQSHLDRCWVEKGNARAIAQEYVKKGGVPMVIVMPNGLSDFYMGDYEQYFNEELMPKVESIYKCNGKRAISGLSMGGFGTVYHALKYPQKYTYAYAMSPAVNDSMVSMVTDVSVLPGMTIETGEDDTTTKMEDITPFVNAMKEKGYVIEYITRPGIHYWNFWQECLPKALQKIGESFK